MVHNVGDGPKFLKGQCVTAKNATPAPDAMVAKEQRILDGGTLSNSKMRGAR